MINLKIKVIVGTIVTIIGFVLFQSCEAESKNELTPSETQTNLDLNKGGFDDNLLEFSKEFENQKFEFRAIKDGNIISSDFLIKNENDEIVFKTDYSLDLALENFELYQVEEVLNIANSLHYNLAEDEYTLIHHRFEVLFENVMSDFYSLPNKTLLEQLYFHKSILDIKLRSLNLNNDCECTLHPGYLVGKTGFSCQEDFFIPIEILNELVKNQENQFSSQYEAEKFKIHIQEQLSPNQVSISFDKVYSFYGEKEQYLESLEDIKNNNQNRGCWFGQGSGHGCCGNYGGCYYYWNPLCWAHDQMCVSCTPSWFCLPGCVPG